MIYYQKILIKFREEYKGSPLNIVCMGGGASMADLLKMPGSTKFIRKLEYLNDRNAIENYLGYKDESTGCNLKTTGDAYHGSDMIVINAALTTDRIRRGDNRAYICIDGEYWKIDFEKLSDEEHNSKYMERRRQEDEFITTFVLSRLLNKYPMAETFVKGWDQC